MADDKSKSGGPDRRRISLSEDYEVRDWCKSLGTTEEELKTAVASVGNDVEAVRHFLAERRR